MTGPRPGRWTVPARALLPVGRGMTGERQREIALRFGVNLVMHVLSGNYKIRPGACSGPARPVGTIDMAQQILLDPLLSMPAIYVLGALTLLIVGVSNLARSEGLALSPCGRRGVAGRAPEPVLAGRGPGAAVGYRVGRDGRPSASQDLSDRPTQTDEALSALEAEIAALGMEMRLATVGDAPDNAGTLLMGELTRMLAEVPRARVAGAILLTDGQLHDAGLVPDMPAPIHALLTGPRGRLGPAAGDRGPRRPSP